MSRYARELDLTDLNAHTYGILATPPGSRVLDIGTADGHPVVAALRDRGCTVDGIEIDPAAASAAADLCARMVVGNVEELDLGAALGDAVYDVVLCLDVLEHLVDPAEVLRRLVPFVAAGGSLVASIPNVTHAAVRLQLMGGSFTYTDTGLLDRTHLRFFDRAEVQQLFADAGWTVTERLAVRREVHETEIPLDLAAVPADVLAAATADPDARVFQWIVVARPVVSDLSSGVATTGLATALLDRIDRLEDAGRQSASHIGWLEEQLRDRGELHDRAVALNERVAELESTLRVRIGELVDAHEQLQAAKASLVVKDEYVARLTRDLDWATGHRVGMVKARARDLARDAVRRTSTAPRGNRLVRGVARRLPEKVKARLR